MAHEANWEPADKSSRCSGRTPAVSVSPPQKRVNQRRATRTRRRAARARERSEQKNQSSNKKAQPRGTAVLAVGSELSMNQPGWASRGDSGGEGSMAG